MWRLIKQFTWETRRLREKTKQEEGCKKKTKERERQGDKDGAAKGKESRLRQPQGRWQPWVPLKLPDSLLQQHGHAWWWQAQRERESSRLGSDSQRVKDSLVFKTTRGMLQKTACSLCLFKCRPAPQRGRRETWEYVFTINPLLCGPMMAK